MVALAQYPVAKQDHSNTTKTQVLKPEKNIPLDYFFSFHNKNFSTVVEKKNKKLPSPIWTIASSAIIPGLGQALHKKWLRAALYASIEATAWFIYFSESHFAKKNQRAYNSYVEQNWSVVKYSQWLIQYYDDNNLTHQLLGELKDAVNDKTPLYTTQDWNVVDIELLESIERATPFVFDNRIIGNNFSHTLPLYGTQQYYELVSKYYQFGAGWSDYNNQLTARSWDGRDVTQLFNEGSRQAKKFNNQYRTAQLMLGILMINHVVSIIDAIITVKITQNKHITTSLSASPNRQMNVKLWF